MNFRKIKPQIKPIDNIHMIEPEKTISKNQIPIYFFKSEEKIVKIKFIFEAGSFYQEKPLQAFFTNKIIGEGTKNYSSKQIAESFDFYGARFILSCDKDQSSVSVICSKINLGNILPILNEVLTVPAFSNKELKIQKKIEFQKYKIAQEKVATVAADEFHQAIFGNFNYYGYNRTEEDFNQINEEDLIPYFQNFYTSDKCYVIITGNLTDKDLQEIFAVSENIKSKGKNITIPKLDALPLQKTKKHIKKNDALQTAIRVGKILFNRTHKDDIGMRVVNMILGGYFGSRLMSNIREDKGYTYGIYSIISSLKYSGYFSIITEVGSSLYKDALKEIYIEIDRLQQHKVAEEELLLVKNYMLGSLLRSIDGPLNFSNLFENLISYNFGKEYIEKYIYEVQNITPERIIDLAQMYLQRDTMNEITVG